MPQKGGAGEDVADREGGGVMGTTRGLSSKFGDLRVRSTPIAEQSIIGAAIGAAMAGYKPVAEIIPIPVKRGKFKHGILKDVLTGPVPDFLEPMSEEELLDWEGRD